MEALSKDLDAVKQSIPDDSKIVKKGIRGISVKIYPENEWEKFFAKSIDFHVTWYYILFS